MPRIYHPEEGDRRIVVSTGNTIVIDRDSHICILHPSGFVWVNNVVGTKAFIALIADYDALQTRYDELERAYDAMRKVYDAEAN